jgi:AcrR family transcriptional regulator
VFWYFKDKEQLLLAVAAAASPFSHIDEIVQAQKNADPISQLQYVADAYLEAYTNSLERQILFQLVGNSTAVPEIRQLLQQQVSSVISGQVTDLIQRGQMKGEICSRLDAEFLAQSFLGTLYSLVTRWEVNGHLPWTRETAVAQLMGLLQCKNTIQ